MYVYIFEVFLFQEQLLAVKPKVPVGQRTQHTPLHIREYLISKFNR